MSENLTITFINYIVFLNVPGFIPELLAVS